MSRTRRFHGSVVIEGRRKSRATLDRGSAQIAKEIIDLGRIIAHSGVVLDGSTYRASEVGSEPGKLVVSYTIEGRQTRNWLQRIIWAVKL